MRCIIILNGECRDLKHLCGLCEASDFIICADGGYKYAEKAGVTPDLVLGDFDSSAEPDNVRIKKYPAEKDFTDGEIAVKTATELGYDEIVLTCSLGGRQDHTLSNLMLLDEKVSICEKNEKVFALTGKTALNEPKGTVFSIIPVTDSVVSVKGAKYPLEKKEIFWGSTLTLSNETTEDETVVEVHSGKILLFVNN
ncbi:MAG: thiamine diphosphokinase [Clostridia bacterium]|nr:thiamine diphosphokinase [Clostridia bacterium]